MPRRNVYYTSMAPREMADSPYEGLEGVVRVFGLPVGLAAAKASRERQQQRWRAEQVQRQKAAQEAASVLGA